VLYGVRVLSVLFVAMQGLPVEQAGDEMDKRLGLGGTMTDIEEVKRDVYYRREPWYDGLKQGFDWAVYVDGIRVRITTTKWGAKRLCRKYKARGLTPAQEREYHTRPRYDY
jgi:hypothetical protein